MRRSHFLFLLIVLLMLALPACRSGGEEKSFPKTLQITAELPEDCPDQVTAYNLTWYKPGEQAAVGAFMGEDSPERVFDDGNSAMGPQYRGEHAGSREILNLYTEQVQGGLNYSFYSSLEDDDVRIRDEEILAYYLRRQQPWESVACNLLPWKYGNGSMEQADSENLDFLPYKDALAQVEGKMSACAFPEHELLLGEAHSLALLNKNRFIYNRAAKEQGEETLPDTLTNEDEYYHFTFRQTLDGIPFCNAYWARNAFGKGGSPCITAIWNQDGLVDFSAGSLVEPGEAVSTDKIITPEEALSVYVEDYSKAIHFENTEILKVELNYLILADSKNLYARPAWVITTATERKAGRGETPHDFDFTEYEVTAVGAYSGVILERETDMR